ncbi:MAG: ExeM/NucH family extracellular endonuclease, partial [Chloroflexi bacterium]
MKKILYLILSVSLILALFPAQNAASAAPTELFFSEYVEGSSFNKALEIYNGTGAAVDLAAGGYNVFMSFNGGTTTLTINLTGTVADGDVYILAQTTADPAILAQADQTDGSGWFNGDDAVLLLKGMTVVDAIGQVGFDPGSEWGSGLISTADNTLRRIETICAGDINGSDVFDPTIQWIGFAQNTFDGLGAHTTNCDTGPQEPKINEFSANTTGTDVEFVEIYGSPDTDYSAYTILEIEGDSGTAVGTVDEAIPVGTTDINGLWLGNLPANALENGTITLLLVNNFTGSLNTDLDTDNNGTFEDTPWDAIVDSIAVNDGGAGDITYGTPALGVSYDGLSFAPGGASRIPDGFDTEAATDWVRNDFDLAGIPGFPGSIILGEAYNTPGEPNQVFVPPPEACGDPFTPIYEVQGSGAASLLIGTEVAIEGVVVGDFQNNASLDDGNLNGFHVQTPTGDGDTATSDGIFVFAPGGMDVAVDDAVRVRGAVSEFNGMTEITASQIWVCSTGSSVTPTSLSLPVASLDDFEPYEGMLVTFPQSLVIAEYFNYDRFGEIVLTSERHLTPSAEFEPGSPELAQAVQDFLLDRITLDDGRTNQNPDPAIHPNGNVFDLTNLFRGGDTISNVTGVLDFSFGLYRIQPTEGADHTNTNERTSGPEDVGGNLKVASFNVLNYFTTIDTGAFICGPAGNQECRGADDADEFTRQRDKIVAALAAIDADVVGLIEIENHPADAPTADLVAGLNDVMGAGTYDYVVTGAIGTDAIRQAIIYKPASVTPVGAYAILDSTVDPRFLDDFNRPVLAQTFMDNTTGGIFTVAVNHLKSKGSDCNDIGDPDLGDGAGNCNLTRLAAAQALVDWLATDPTNSGDEDFLIIGDLNSYDKEDPVDAILASSDDELGTADDYTDLIFEYQGEDAYSYVFDGQIGYLDHALANAGLVGEVTGTTVWHINADEPDLIDYDTTFKQPAQDDLYAPDPYRSSDHDPVIVGLNVCDEIAPTLEVTVSPDVLWPANHKYVKVEATVTTADNFDPNPTVTLVSVTSNEPDNGEDDGDTVNDIV